MLKIRFHDIDLLKSGRFQKSGCLVIVKEIVSKHGGFGGIYIYMHTHTSFSLCFCISVSLFFLSLGHLG